MSPKPAADGRPSLRGDYEISSESNLDRDSSLIFLHDTYNIYVLAVLELQSLMYTMSYKP